MCSMLYTSNYTLCIQASQHSSYAACVIVILVAAQNSLAVITAAKPYLVANIVTSRIHLVQLWPPLFINANDDWHHSQRSHVCVLHHTECITGVLQSSMSDAPQLMLPDFHLELDLQVQCRHTSTICTFWLVYCMTVLYVISQLTSYCFCDDVHLA